MASAYSKAAWLLTSRIVWWAPRILRRLGEAATYSVRLDVRYHVGGRVYKGYVQAEHLDTGFVVEALLFGPAGESYRLLVESGPYRLVVDPGEAAEGGRSGLEAKQAV